MATYHRTQQADVLHLHLAPAPGTLFDASALAKPILNAALSYSAHKTLVHDPAIIVERLMNQDRTAAEYCHFSIAEQVGAVLGTWDDHVQAVHMCDYDATPDDLCFAATCPGPIHLIVVADRKTSALESLLSALDASLAQAYADLMGSPKPDCLLDAQVVDQQDVENRVGYGALLASTYNPSIRVWER